jgi:hypothetical protein
MNFPITVEKQRPIGFTATGVNTGPETQKAGPI